MRDLTVEAEILEQYEQYIEADLAGNEHAARRHERKMNEALEKLIPQQRPASECE